MEDTIPLSPPKHVRLLVQPELELPLATSFFVERDAFLSPVKRQLESQPGPSSASTTSRAKRYRLSDNRLPPPLLSQRMGKTWSSGSRSRMTVKSWNLLVLRMIMLLCQWRLWNQSLRGFCQRKGQYIYVLVKWLKFAISSWIHVGHGAVRLLPCYNNLLPFCSTGIFDICYALHQITLTF